MPAMRGRGAERGREAVGEVAVWGGGGGEGGRGEEWRGRAG